MNRKQLIILLVLVVLIGGAGLFLFKQNADSWNASAPRVGQKLMPDLAVNDVEQITIRSAEGELNLVKSDNLWRVQERAMYPANFSQISDFLIKAADLKVAQSESVGPSQLPRLELVEPGQGDNAGTLVELKGKDAQPISSLLLGKKHMRKAEPGSPFGGEGWPDGRYVLAAGSKDVALISDPLANLEPKPESWLNKDFFKIEKARSVELISPEAENSWKIARETESGEWSLSDAKGDEKLDRSKASGATNPFSYPSFNDVVGKEVPAEETGMSNPTVVKVETFDHLTYTVKIGNKSGEDNFHLALEVSGNLPKERTPVPDEDPEAKEKLDKEFAEANQKTEEKLKQEKRFENWTYLVSKWTVDAVLKERSQILAEATEETEETSVPPPQEQALPTLPSFLGDPLAIPPPLPTDPVPLPESAPETPETTPESAPEQPESPPEKSDT